MLTHISVYVNVFPNLELDICRRLSLLVGFHQYRCVREWMTRISFLFFKHWYHQATEEQEEVEDDDGDEDKERTVFFCVDILLFFS